MEYDLAMATHLWPATTIPQDLRITRPRISC